MISLFVQELIGALVQAVGFALIPFIVWLIVGRKKEKFSAYVGLKKPEPEKQGRRYSDDEIDALLGDDRKDNGEKANFTQALPEAEEEQERAKDDTLNNHDQVWTYLLLLHNQ